MDLFNIFKQINLLVKLKYILKCANSSVFSLKSSLLSYYTLLTCISFVFIACNTETTETKEKVTWWVGSDSHVGYSLYEDQLEIAVEDVNELSISNFAITLGDIIDERYGDPYQNFIRYQEVMSKLPHEYTFVLGNHDNNGREVPVLPVTEPVFFSKYVGGLRIIGFSDEHLSENYNRDLEISEETQEWLRDELLRDPEIPTVIMTHQAIKEFDVFPEGRTKIEFYDEWIEPNIDEFNLVLWVSGHAHEWFFEKDVDNYGFSKLIVASILFSNQSSFMTIEEFENSIEVSFRFRDHLNKEWISIFDMDQIYIEFTK